MSTIKVTNLKNESFAGDQLYLKTDGKIGVGVAAPASEAGWGNILHINSASAGAHIRFTDNTSGSTAGDGSYIGHYGNDTYLVNKESSGKIIFNANSSERLRIASTGQVLLGTTTPSAYSNRILTVAAADNDSGIEIRTATDHGGQISFSDGSAADATNYRGYIRYDHDGDYMRLGTSSTERLRIDSSGLITQGGKTASNHGSPNLLLWGADPTLHITSTGSTNNSSFAGIKFAVAGGSTGDYSKAGIFVQRQSGYTDLDMIFAFRSTADTAGVAISDEKIRFTSDGNLKASNFAGRNKIINGAMVLSQRGASFTSTGTEYIMDRFIHTDSASLSFDTTTTHDSSGPVGFSKCLKITPDSTQTPTGSMNGLIQQKIEGQNLQNLAFGTASAKKITLSFYAKSSAQNNNHQYSVQLRKYNAGNDRQFVNRAFTVTSSWQRFTMTFNGDTSESIRNDEENGMQVIFHLCNGPDDIAAEVSTFSRTTNSGLYTAVTGQSNFMDNTSNEFYLTGVQLEVGDVATDFEHRLYDEELASCQRYYEEAMINGQSYVDSSQHVGIPAKYAVTKRAAATVSWTLDSSGNMSGTSPQSIHRNRLDGAYAYQSAAAAGNYYYYYIYKADSEI
jgi:hypothetical protein